MKQHPPRTRTTPGPGRTWILVLLLALSGLIGSGTLADDRSGWSGKWRLDKERSDPPTELMKALEVPWYARAAAMVFRPTLDVTVVEGGLEIASVTLFGATRERLYGDNVERDGEDPLGRTYRERSQWKSVDEVVIFRRLALDSGRTANIEATWKLGNTSMSSLIEINLESGSPVRVRRVFGRTD